MNATHPVSICREIYDPRLCSQTQTDVQHASTQMVARSNGTRSNGGGRNASARSISFQSWSRNAIMARKT